MHFFWPSLRCKVIEQMVKSRYLVEFPAQKKEPKWFQNLGRFKKNSSCSVAKKSPKNWTGRCLSLNMVRRKRFIKWQTPSRNAKSSFEGANPTPPSPMQQWRPPARTTIVSHTVGGLGSEGDKTVSRRTSRAQKLEPHLLAKCQIFIWRCEPNAAQPNAAVAPACHG